MPRGKKRNGAPGSSKIARLVLVCRLLNQHRAKYIVIGGWATTLNGAARATKDVDLLIPKDLHNTAAVLEALKGLMFGMAGEIEPEEVMGKPFTIIGDIPRVDLLTVAGKVRFDEAIKTAKVTTVDGEKIIYADVETLIQTKHTGRPQDQVDIDRLLQIIGKSRRRRSKKSRRKAP